MARSLARGLAEEGYTVDVAFDGADGLARASTEPYDAIILDLMLPKLNGFAVTAALRQAGIRVPVLMLTAKQGEFDQTESARHRSGRLSVQAVLLSGAAGPAARPDPPGRSGAGRRADPRRHQPGHPGTPLLAGRRRSDPDGPGVRPAPVPVCTGLANLSRRRSLLQHVWDPSDDRDANVVEVYIGYLRRKLDRPANARISIPSAVPATGFRERSRPRRPPMLRRTRHFRSGVRFRVTVAAVLAVACALGVSAAVVGVVLQHDRHNVLLTTAQVQARAVEALNQTLKPPLELPSAPTLQSGLVQVLSNGQVLAASHLLHDQPALWTPGEPDIQVVPRLVVRSRA